GECRAIELDPLPCTLGAYGATRQPARARVVVLGERRITLGVERKVLEVPRHTPVLLGEVLVQAPVELPAEGAEIIHVLHDDDRPVGGAETGRALQVERVDWASLELEDGLIRVVR